MQRLNPGLKLAYACGTVPMTTQDLAFNFFLLLFYRQVFELSGTLAGPRASSLPTSSRPARDNALLFMENTFVTPHVGSASMRMRPETRRRAARGIALVLSGRWPMSCVNPTVLPRIPLTRWQPYSMDRGPNR